MNQKKAYIRPFAHTRSRLCRAAVHLCSRRNRAEGCFIKKEQDRPDLKLHVCRRINENFDPEKISALRAASHGSTGMSCHIIMPNPAYWADSSLFVWFPAETRVFMKPPSGLTHLSARWKR